MPQCYLVSEIAIECDAAGAQVSSDVSICGVFTSAKLANAAVLTWHERDYVPVGLGDFDSYKLSKPDGLLHLIACVDRQSWEVSVEMIELNTEFSMSLLDPSLPEEKMTSVKPISDAATQTNGSGDTQGIADEQPKNKGGRPRKVSQSVDQQAKFSPAAATGGPKDTVISMQNVKSPTISTPARNTLSKESASVASSSVGKQVQSTSAEKVLTRSAEKRRRSSSTERKDLALQRPLSATELEEQDRRFRDERRRQKVLKELNRLGTWKN